jgi:hypothetical protein
MQRCRINYWNCSKFADFIRGTKKPLALEWKQWGEWKSEQKKQRPIRFWLSETGLNMLQNFCMFPADVYREIKYYIHNRWIDKTHYIKTGFKPGHYYELDYKILHGLFNELVDLVEIEFAYLSTYDKTKNYNFKRGRCVEAGLDYLDWACNIKYNEDYLVDKKDKLYGKLTPQALASQKIKELYTWWKDIRPNRPEPIDLINFDMKDSFDFSKKELPKYKKLEKIEKAYDKEDTKMLIELIKIRSYLWS